MGTSGRQLVLSCLRHLPGNSGGTADLLGKLNKALNLNDQR